MTHIAWDHGAIRDAFIDVFGAAFVSDILKQKTTKTLCGKCVRMSVIDNQTAQCQDCLATSKHEEETTARLLKEFDGRQ